MRDRNRISSPAAGRSAGMDRRGFFARLGLLLAALVASRTAGSGAPPEGVPLSKRRASYFRRLAG